MEKTQIKSITLEPNSIEAVRFFHENNIDLINKSLDNKHLN